MKGKGGGVLGRGYPKMGCFYLGQGRCRVDEIENKKRIILYSICSTFIVKKIIFLISYYC